MAGRFVQRQGWRLIEVAVSTASSGADAIWRLEVLKLERSLGERQVRLFGVDE